MAEEILRRRTKSRCNRLELYLVIEKNATVTLPRNLANGLKKEKSEDQMGLFPSGVERTRGKVF